MTQLSTAIYAYSAIYNQENIARQVAMCKAFAVENGFSIVGVYEDMGGERANRTRLLDDAENRKIQKVIVVRFDRFSRKSSEKQTIVKQLQAARVTIEPVEFSDEPLEKMLANMRNTLSKRVIP